MNLPKVSVIVPIYNAEKYIKNCVDSILNQTLKELEIILVDDGSTDGSGLMVDNYAKQDNRIKVIHQENKGVAAARNKGILKSIGQYVAFVDVDDWIEEIMYESMYNIGIKSRAEIVVCGYVEEYISSNNIIYNDNDIGDSIITKEEIRNKFCEFLNNKKNFCSAALWNKIYRKDFISEEKLFIDESITIAEDLCFNINAILKANIMVGINKAFYHYMKVNQESIMVGMSEDKIYCHINARTKIIENLIHNNIDVISYIRYENSKNLNSILHLCVYKIRDKLSTHKKYLQVIAILKDEEFTRSLNNYDETYLSKPMKIITRVIKLKMYLVVYGILFVYSKVY